MESQPKPAGPEGSPEDRIAALEDKMTYKVGANFRENQTIRKDFQGRGENIKREVNAAVKEFGPLSKILYIESW